MRERCDSGWRNENDARRAMARAGRRLHASGMSPGRSGNLSVRWRRSAADGYLITPSGIALEALDGDALIWCPIEPIASTACFADAAPSAFPSAFPLDPPRPSSEWPMHAALYREAGAGAVVHVHSPQATALSCSARVQRDGVPAIHYMMAATGGERLRCAGYETFGSMALATRMMAALDGRQACLLAHHGQIAHAATLWQAVELAEEVERSCALYAQALALGDPVTLDVSEIGRVARRLAERG